MSHLEYFLNYKKRGLCVYGITASFFFLICPLFAEDSLLVIQPEPGAYAQDIAVSISAPPQYTITYAFSRNSAEADVVYAEPLLLTALPQEERSYKIIARLHNPEHSSAPQIFEYTIDKKAPPAPEISQPSGRYQNGLTLEFVQPSSGHQIAYSLGGSRSQAIGIWNGEKIFLREASQTSRSYAITAYSVDRSGNKSETRRWEYVIEKKPTVQGKYLNIRSPAPGNFANQQLLYIEHRGYEWIRYTVDGKNPLVHGVEYSTAKLLPYSGEITLTVAAKAIDSDFVEYQNVNYQVNPTPILSPGIPESGIYSRNLRFKASLPEAYYCLEERRPRPGDLTLTSEVLLQGLPQGVRILPLRIYVPGLAGTQSADYRFYYIIDTRDPPEPVISLKPAAGQPGAWLMEINAAPGSAIYYTTDGSIPGNSKNPYLAPVLLRASPVEEGGGASVLIRAVAHSDTGLPGKEVSELLTFGGRLSTLPVITIEQSETNQDALIAAQAPGLQVVYGIAEDPEDLPDLNSLSPVFGNQNLLAVPRGLAATFYLIFAAKNSAGLLSSTTEIHKVEIDKRANLKPELLLFGQQVALLGVKPLYYTVKGIFADEQPHPLPTEIEETAPTASTTYLDYFTLASDDYRIKKYEITAWSGSPTASGDNSITRVVTIPPAIPSLPVWSGVADKGIYKDTAQIRFAISPENIAVYYTLIQISGDSRLTLIEEEKAPEPLMIAGRQGEEIKYQLNLWQTNLNSQKRSEVAVIEFTIDKKLPEIPVLSGFVDNGIYREAVTLTWQNSEPDDTIFMSVTTNGSQPGSPFGAERLPVSQEVVFDVPEGEATTYRIRVGAEDRAGNRLADDQIQVFTIDKTQVPLPSLTGLPTAGQSSPKPVTVFYDTSVYPDLSLFYELTEDGSQPSAPTVTSERMSDPLLLPGKAGEIVVYTLNIKSRNPEERWSRYSKVVRVAVDLREIALPPPPRLIRNGRQVVLSWEAPPESFVFFRLPDRGGVGFEIYNEPLALEVAETDEIIRIETYLEDRGGRRSPRRFFALPVPPRSNEQLVRLDQKFVGGEPFVDVVLLKEEQLLRYELTADGRQPPQVTEFSPVLTQAVSVKASPGEEVEYWLRVRLFRDSLDEVGSIEQVERFVIDRKAPVAPSVFGVKEGGIYNQDPIIELKTGDGAIFFQVGLTSRLARQAPAFSLYREAIKIIIPDNTINDYKLVAYTEDEAGNRSPKLELRFTIDKAAIYLAPNGNNENFGTHASPVRTFARALEIAYENNRHTFFLAAGDYSLTHPINRQGSLRIVGGFDPSDWTIKPDNVSRLLVTDRFESSDKTVMIFRGEQARAEFRNFEIVVPRGLTLIDQNQGHIELTDLKITVNGDSQRALFYLEKARLDLRGVNLKTDGGVSHPLILGKNSQILLSGSLIEAQTTAEHQTVIDLKANSFLEIKNTTVKVISEKSATLIQAVQSQLIIADNSQLSVKKSAIQGNLLYLHNSKALISRAALEADVAGQGFGLAGVGSELTLERCNLKVKAEASALAIRLDDSLFKFSHNIITSGPSGQSNGIFNLNNSQGQVTNNYIFGKIATHLTGFEISSSSVDWFYNTIILESSNITNQGFVLRENSRIRFINNIIALEIGASSGEAWTGSPSNLMVQANSISGWPIIARFNNAAEIFNLRDFNNLDRVSSGGIFDKNFSESVSRTFVEDVFKETAALPRLQVGSQCIDSGIDVSRYNWEAADWDDLPRPEPGGSAKNRAPDVGAQEFYPSDRF